MHKIKVEIVKTDEQIRIVENLAGVIWEEHYMPIIGPDQIKYMLDKYQSYDAIASSISKGYTYYLAGFDDVPCGYSAIKVDGGIFLSKFYVEKHYRGMGIGKEMFRCIVETAVNKNQRRIWLTCNKYNSDTINIYEKMGFRIIDSIVTDIGNGFVMDDYVLEIDITKIQSHKT